MGTQECTECIQSLFHLFTRWHAVREHSRDRPEVVIAFSKIDNRCTSTPMEAVDLFGGFKIIKDSMWADPHQSRA